MSDAEFSGFFVFVLIGGWIAVAFFTSDAAYEKGRDGFNWFWLGLLFGPLALLAVAAQGDRRTRLYMRFLAEAQGYGDKQPAGDAALDKGWNKETQNWETTDNS